MKSKEFFCSLLIVALVGGTGGVATAGEDSDLSWNTIDGGGEMFMTGGTFEWSGTIGQPDAGGMTGDAFVLSGGFWVAGCSVAAECGDGDDCTLDTCDPPSPEASLDGCVHEYQQQLFGDICEPYCLPDCPQPDLDDILCGVGIISSE